jgi:hypothetical protein
MTTIIRKLPFASPAASGLGTISITPEENEIVAYPNLIGWWRADTGFVPSGANVGWTDRKAGMRLIPFRPPHMPSLITAGAYNGKSALQYPDASTAVGEMYDGGLDLFPVGRSYTFVHVGQSPAGNIAFYGNGNTLATASYLGHRLDDRLVNMHQNTFQAEILPVARTAPKLVINSYDFATKDNLLRVNRGAQTGSKLTVTPEVAGSQQLHVGAVGTIGAQSLPNRLGTIAEFMIFDAPILNGDHNDLLTKLESYLGDRYAIAPS